MLNLSDELSKINDILYYPPLFCKKEKKQLISCINELCKDYLQLNPLCFSEPYIHDLLTEDLLEILLEQTQHLFEFDISEDLLPIIDKGVKYFYSQIVPRRSYNKTFIRHQPNINKMEQHLHILRNKPQPEQRTEAWYKFRHSVLTASNAWKTFGTQATQNQLIYEKCLPLNTNKYTNNISTESPLHWGQKYEPLSVLLYEHIHGTKIEDYGCIPHDTYKFLAASPDGINVDNTSPLYGRMLEIKNVVNRPITGIPKFEYWIQMQLQMETCQLNECDFLETQFQEYEDEEEFNADGTFTHTETDDPKGIILYFIKDGKYHYEYAPLFISKEDYEIWENEVMERNAQYTWIKTIYWHLYKISCVLVLRNKLWFQEAVIHLKNIWSTIEKERESGYEHRAPKQKQKSAEKKETKPETKCFINIETIKLDDTPLSSSSSCGMKNSFSQESLTIIPSKN